jgi:hypothetical protein
MCPYWTDVNPTHGASLGRIRSLILSKLKKGTEPLHYYFANSCVNQGGPGGRGALAGPLIAQQAKFARA